MDEQKLVPKLRFPGFTDPWEQRKLGEIYKRVNERNDGTLGRDKWISVAKMYFQDPEKVQSNNLDTRTYVMKKGDIAFEGHPNNEFKFGRFVLNDIGTGIISELFPIYRPIVKYDLEFWKYAIQLERIMAPIFSKSITSSGNSSNKLDQNHFLNQMISIPTIDEQKKIGLILKTITNLITLHQRKLEHLKLKKKSLLQKLFPREGELYPELRFPGFTDPWEQRKLGEVFDERNEKGEQGELLSVTIGAGVVRTEDLERAVNTSDDRYNYKVVKKGDLIYNTMRMWQGACGSSLYTGIVSPAYTVLVPLAGNSSKFFAHYFKRKDLLYLFKRYSQGLTSDTWNLKFNVLKEIKICVPLIEEQYKIADFLEAYDSNLTLHQRKLEHLQLLKKALLQQLFV